MILLAPLVIILWSIITIPVLRPTFPMDSAFAATITPTINMIAIEDTIGRNGSTALTFSLNRLLMPSPSATGRRIIWTVEIKSLKVGTGIHCPARR